MTHGNRSFILRETIVLLVCIALSVFTLAFLAPVLAEIFNADSARNDARLVCKSCITDEAAEYGEIIIVVKAAGRYYLFSYDISQDELYEYPDNPIKEIAGESDISAGLENLCEIADGRAITDISDEMQRLPMNVHCFAGGTLKILSKKIQKST